MRALRWLLITAIVVGVVLGISPLLLQLWMEREFAKVGIEASFDNFDLDYLLGELELGGVRMSTAEGATLELFEVSVDFDWRTLGSGRVHLSKFEAQGVKVDAELLPPLVAVLRRRLGWISGPGPAEQLRVRRARLANIEICRQDSADCLHLEEGAANLLDINFGESDWEVVGRGPVSLTKAFWREQTGGSALFYLGEYKSANLAFSPSRWRATEMHVVNLQLLENPAPEQVSGSLYQTQIGELHTDYVDLSRDPWILRFGVLQLISPRQALERDATGALRWPDYFLSRLPPRPEAVEVSFDGINLQGGTLVWQDHQQQPPLRLVLNQMKAAVGSSSLERPQEFTPLELAFSLSPRGAVQLAGSIQNLFDPAAVDLKLVFEQLDLAQVAAYARPLLGGTATAGQLDMAVEVDNRQGPLGGELRVRLADLRLGEAGPAGRALVQQLAEIDGGGGATFSAPVQLSQSVTLQQLPEALGAILRRRVAQLAAKPQ